MNLSVAAVFAAPTIAELAERIEAERRGEIETDVDGTGLVDGLAASLLQPPTGGGQSLVPLRTDGAATPLFCIHGLGGHVASFLPLAKALAEARPVYGLQAQGLGPDQQPHDRIEAMAAFYLREIRQAQPRGPYLLAGWSMGGLIALETAAGLAAAGEEVALVAMLDTYLSAEEFSAQDLNDQSVIHWLGAALESTAGGVEGTAAGASNGSGSRSARSWPTALARPRSAGWPKYAKPHLAAFEAYVPRPYQGRAVLLSAQDSNGPDPRWKSLCPRLRRGNCSRQSL